MPAVRLINPRELSPPIGFAHVAVAGDFVWLGGQISSDGSGRVLHRGDFTGQFRRALANVAIALRSAGCRPSSVVKLTHYVTNVEAYHAARGDVGRAYREVFGKHYPAASLFEVKALAEPDAMIEIEAVAVRDSSTTASAEEDPDGQR